MAYTLSLYTDSCRLHTTQVWERMTTQGPAACVGGGDALMLRWVPFSVGLVFRGRLVCGVATVVGCPRLLHCSTAALQHVGAGGAHVVLFPLLACLSVMLSLCDTWRHAMRRPLCSFHALCLLCSTILFSLLLPCSSLLSPCFHALSCLYHPCRPSAPAHTWLYFCALLSCSLLSCGSRHPGC